MRLLEIGSGPVSLLAFGVEQGLFEVTAVDPLASVYDEILSKYGISYPIKPRTGYAERLVKSFGKDSFDIVYSSNSLVGVLTTPHLAGPSLEQGTAHSALVRPDLLGQQLGGRLARGDSR